MFLPQFQCFVAVIEEALFSRAAKRSNATQPSLSSGIKQLELELGVPNFPRGRGQRFHRRESPTHCDFRASTRRLFGLGLRRCLGAGKRLWPRPPHVVSLRSIGSLQRPLRMPHHMRQGLQKAQTRRFAHPVPVPQCSRRSQRRPAVPTNPQMNSIEFVDCLP
jgi:Bacterial regulatory helix-turn-helix protein, lysR family